jgi:hypothetical protein
MRSTGVPLFRSLTVLTLLLTPHRNLGLNDDVIVQQLLSQYNPDRGIGDGDLSALQQPALPVARAIQESTLATIEGLLTEDNHGICIALVQPPGMCPDRARISVALTVQIRHGEDVLLSFSLRQVPLRGGGCHSFEASAGRSRR